MKTITIEVTSIQSVEIQIDHLDNSEGIHELLEDLEAAKKEGDGWLVEQVSSGGEPYYGKSMISSYGPMISYDSEFCFTDTSDKDDPIWFSWEEIHNSIEIENEEFVLDDENIQENDLISARIKFTDEPVMFFEFEVEDEFELDENILDKIVLQITNIKSNAIEYLEASGVDILSGITLMGEEADNFDINEISDQTSMHCEIRRYENICDRLVSSLLFEFDDYADILTIHPDFQSILSSY